jgi:hypothetical protein
MINADITNLGRPPMPIIIRRVEPADIPQMAFIRAQEWGTEAFWKEPAPMASVVSKHINKKNPNGRPRPFAISLRAVWQRWGR